MAIDIVPSPHHFLSKVQFELQDFYIRIVGGSLQPGFCWFGFIGKNITAHECSLVRRLQEFVPA